jgi:hypothetical protein
MTQQGPSPGDLLISRRRSDGRYEISIVPGHPQFTVEKQHEAVQQAAAFAARSGSNVWMAEPNGYVLMRPTKRTES